MYLKIILQVEKTTEGFTCESLERSLSMMTSASFESEGLYSWRKSKREICPHSTQTNGLPLSKTPEIKRANPEVYRWPHSRRSVLSSKGPGPSQSAFSQKEC